MKFSIIKATLKSLIHIKFKTRALYTTLPGVAKTSKKD